MIQGRVAQTKGMQPHTCAAAQGFPGTVQSRADPLLDTNRLHEPTKCRKCAASGEEEKGTKLVHANLECFIRLTQHSVRKSENTLISIMWQC